MQGVGKTFPLANSISNHRLSNPFRTNPVVFSLEGYRFSLISSEPSHVLQQTSRRSSPEAAEDPDGSMCQQSLCTSYALALEPSINQRTLGLGRSIDSARHRHNTGGNSKRSGALSLPSGHERDSSLSTAWSPTIVFLLESQGFWGGRERHGLSCCCVC